MRQFQKWVLTLGLATATPSLGLAGPLSLWKSNQDASGKTGTTAQAGVKISNQQVANQVASALKNSNLSGQNIKVEYKNGLLKLNGSVQTPEQRDLAESAARRVPNVTYVENHLTVQTPRKVHQGGFQQVQYAAPQATQFEAAPVAPAAVQPMQLPVETTEGNQQVADHAAHALRNAGFRGQGVQLQYSAGVLTLTGAVLSPAYKDSANVICSQVPGVRQVNNQLTVAEQQTQPVAYQPAEQVAPGPVGPGSPIPPAAGPPAVGPGPQAYPTPNGSNMIYDQPNLPNHSWPTYATYPNYAQANYPKQYSASAWPYIGPFYPYPQVPLGWRKVQMEWDDGYWQLNFRPRTEKWWWYMNPNNW